MSLEITRVTTLPSYLVLHASDLASIANEKSMELGGI